MPTSLQLLLQLHVFDTDLNLSVSFKIHSFISLFSELLYCYLDSYFILLFTNLTYYKFRIYFLALFLYFPPYLQKPFVSFQIYIIFPFHEY